MSRDNEGDGSVRKRNRDREWTKDTAGVLARFSFPWSPSEEIWNEECRSFSHTPTLLVKSLSVRSEQQFFAKASSFYAVDEENLLCFARKPVFTQPARSLYSPRLRFRQVSPISAKPELRPAIYAGEVRQRRVPAFRLDRHRHHTAGSVSAAETCP